MRYGVISDVHGNLHALSSALDVLRRAGVDRYLCLGDLVGFGPYPNECVRHLAELDAVHVAGNHDLIAVGRLGEERCSRLARDSLRWTRKTLEPDVRRYLERLPLVAMPSAETVMAHASLDDPERYVVRPEQVREQLDQLRREYPNARLLLLGHTHHAMAVAERSGALLRRGRTVPVLSQDERVLLNPGSVGQSREFSPYGRVAVIDHSAGQATFYTIRYDVAACRRALQARGLPASSCHRKPYTVRAAAKRARRIVSSTRRRVLGSRRP